MIKFWSPEKTYKKYQGEIDEAINRVLESGKLCLGANPDIQEFEQIFAGYVGSQYAIMTGGGTHSLFLIYKGLGLGPGDEVITVSHTYIATIDQIAAVGATPILVDIGEDGLIDPVEVSKAITKNTKAIVAVHLEGKVCDMELLQDIADRHGIVLIDDAAQALGSYYQGRMTGNIAHASAFSLYPAKILGSIGNAGMITTNDHELAEYCRLARNHFHIGKVNDQNVKWGYNLEPDGIQAAVLKVKIKYLDDFIQRRAEIAKKYDDAFQGLPLILPIQQPGRVYQDYVIRLKERDKFVEYLKENGVETIGHNLIHNHAYPIVKIYNTLPKSEIYLNTQVRIPCNPDLTDEEIDYVINTIKNYFS